MPAAELLADGADEALEGGLGRGLGGVVALLGRPAEHDHPAATVKRPGQGMEEVVETAQPGR